MMFEYSLPEDIDVICEGVIGDLMMKLGISISQKTDRASLPYNCELSYDVPFDYSDPSTNTYVNRSIIKYLLYNDIYKLRYYVYIEKLNPGYIYHFRYHIRTNNINNDSTFQ